jgi:1-acyl-sn-glycerol-3-phosphate acyltransferase
VSKVKNWHYLKRPDFVFGLAAAILFQGRRVLSEDAARIHGLLQTRYEGLEHIPPRGPMCVVINHYSTPTHHVTFTVLAVSLGVTRQRDPALPPGERELAWLTQNQWPRERADGHRRHDPLTYWIFSRMERVYGLVPHSPLTGDIAGRAAALHALLRRATGRAPGQNGRPQPVALAPEGRNAPQLAEPWPGVGTMMGLLSAAAVPLVPCGISEPHEGHTVRYGPPFRLDPLRDLSRAERDRAWATTVMRHIAALLPPAMRGPYGEASDRQ